MRISGLVNAYHGQGSAPPEPISRPVSSVWLEPTAWVQTWSNRPTSRTEIGLRILSQDEIDTARAEAAKRAWSMHPEPDDHEGRVECFNDAVIRQVIAKAMTMAHDAARAFFSMPEDQAFEHMTSDGCLAVFEAYELAVVQTSPLNAEATDDEVLSLVERLERGEVPTGRVRRFLKLIHDELNGD